MSIKVRETTYKGNGKQISFTILCEGSNNDVKETSEMTINDLARVKFRFIQVKEWLLQIQYIGRKILKDCTVKMKVNNLAEKICSEEFSSNWEVLGDTFVHLWSDLSDVRVFHFDVTVNAFKVEATIYKKLCDDTEFTDFLLTTTDGSVAVHKAYLAAHSDVFKAMLCQEWKETNEGRIQISGVSLQTLQHLKDYMYMGTLPDDGLLPLLSIASCYMIKELKKECISKLTQAIKPENLHDFFEYSIENKIPEMTFALIKAIPQGVLEDAEKALLEKQSKEEIEEE